MSVALEVNGRLTFYNTNQITGISFRRALNFSNLFHDGESRVILNHGLNVWLSKEDKLS